MSSRFDLIAQQLLQKPFADCTINELRQLTDKYPYLAPAQFLLAKKLLVEADPAANKQMQKAALYYHQPAAFDAFLNFEEIDIDAYLESESMEDAEEEEDNLPALQLSQVKVHTAEPALAAKPDAKQAETAAPVFLRPLPSLQLQPDPQPDAPAFEPFHTVDYFASQGIELSSDEVSKDKVGKQMKSFTQWLKTMKRLPASEQIKTLEPNAEKKVVNLAAHSVEDAEIVTETMAEIWLKQGNWEKAIEIYQKLSLLHPSKRAYFASKLESLKKRI